MDFKEEIQKVIESKSAILNGSDILINIEENTSQCSFFIKSRNNITVIHIDKNFAEIIIRLLICYTKTYPAGAFLAGVDFLLAKRESRKSIIKFGLTQLYKEPFEFLRKYDVTSHFDLFRDKRLSEVRELVFSFLINHEIGHILFDKKDSITGIYKDIMNEVNNHLPAEANLPYEYFNNKIRITEARKEGLSAKQVLIEEIFCDALGAMAIFELSISKEQPVEFSLGMIRFFIMTNHLLYALDNETHRLEDLRTRFRRMQRPEIMKIRIEGFSKVLNFLCKHYSTRGLKKETEYTIDELIVFLLDQTFLRSKDIECFFDGTPVFSSYEELFLQLTKSTEASNHEATFIGLSSLNDYLVNVAKDTMDIIETNANTLGIDFEEMENRMI